MDDKALGLTHRMVVLARSRYAIPILLCLEVAESTIVPLPYEAIFIAMCLSAKERTWIFVIVTVIGSAIAGSILYGLGAGLAEPISNKLGIESAVQSYRATFEDRGAVLIFLGGLTPVPSYLVNLVAGATGYPFINFLAFFSVSRLIRFGILGVLLYFFGETILKLWDRQPQWLKALIVAVLILGAAVWSLSVVI